MFIKTCLKKKGIAEKKWVFRQALACRGKHGGTLRPSWRRFGHFLPAPSWWCRLCCQSLTTLPGIGGPIPCGDGRFCYPGFGRPHILWSRLPPEEVIVPTVRNQTGISGLEERNMKDQVYAFQGKQQPKPGRMGRHHFYDWEWAKVSIIELL